MSLAVKRLGGNKVKIDVLVARREFLAGTLSREDVATVDKMLPGMLTGLKPAHVERTPSDETATSGEAKA